MTAPTLTTQRLVLRPYLRSDIPDLVRLIGAREVAATTLRIPHPYSVPDADEFLASLDAGDELRLAIVLRGSSELAGGIGLRMEKSHQSAELGYWIGLPYWGNGFATEAARALVQHGFDVMKLHRIYASHFSNNPASARVLQKLGMKPEGRLRDHILKWGHYYDLVLYGMLASDFGLTSS